MPVQILYHPETRDIRVIDPPVDAQGNPILPEGQNLVAVTISDQEAAKFEQAGSFVLDQNGTTITVTPPGPVSDEEIERDAATGDLVTQYQAAMDRLDQIIGAASPTNAQVIAAVRDMATIQRRTLRFLRARHSGA